MIQVDSISKGFKDRNGQFISVLNQLSFKVDSGEIFGLIGSSGVGKSTALRSLNLLEKPDSGRVLIHGEDLMKKSLNELNLVRQKTGMIFQQFNLVSNRTVSENVAFPLQIAGRKKKQIQERVEECLHWVGLSEKRNHYPSQLSGGQKQRVGIARSIANRPQILLADEPTSALDPLTKKEIVDCLINVNQKLGVVIVIATHEMEVVKRLCHRVALIHQGKIHDEFPIVQNGMKPTTEYGKAFVEAGL